MHSRPINCGPLRTAHSWPGARPHKPTGSWPGSSSQGAAGCRWQHPCRRPGRQKTSMQWVTCDESGSVDSAWRLGQPSLHVLATAFMCAEGSATFPRVEPPSREIRLVHGRCVLCLLCRPHITSLPLLTDKFAAGQSNWRCGQSNWRCEWRALSTGPLAPCWKYTTQPSSGVGGPCSHHHHRPETIPATAARPGFWVAASRNISAGRAESIWFGACAVGTRTPAGFESAGIRLGVGVTSAAVTGGSGAHTAGSIRPRRGSREGWH